MIDSLFANLLDVLTRLLIAAVPVILAITMPEAARGYAASRFGDSVARAYKRLTFNPIPHIDPIGTLAVPFAFFVFSAMTGAPFMLLGWAKPLPLSDGRLRNPRISIRYVSGAVIAASVVMMLAWAIISGLTLGALDNPLIRILHRMASYGVQINAIFAVFSLLPVPPLPGGKILLTFLDWRQGEMLRRLEPHVFLIVLVLALSGVIGVLMQPLLWLANVVGSLFIFL